ncbi:MAG: hypothetical protein BWX72_00493 [Firmicutes bacterium ADurb.Bin080]|nr:MAG: hypothetical protein BWX72_00493 [Firmicutes bacterium ADurb.Bin080]
MDVLISSTLVDISFERSTLSLTDRKPITDSSPPTLRRSVENSGASKPRKA